MTMLALLLSRSRVRRCTLHVRGVALLGAVLPPRWYVGAGRLAPETSPARGPNPPRGSPPALPIRRARRWLAPDCCGHGEGPARRLATRPHRMRAGRIGRRRGRLPDTVPQLSLDAGLRPESRSAAGSESTTRWGSRRRGVITCRRPPAGQADGMAATDRGRARPFVVIAPTRRSRRSGATSSGTYSSTERRRVLRSY